MTTARPRLVLRGIRKSYASPVLDGVDLSLAPGDVHALVGANGAGKSTLARIVAGLTTADDGVMEIDGSHYAPARKVDGERRGVHIVQQELGLVSSLSVAENVFFSRLPRRAGFIRRRELGARTRAALARVGLEDLSPDTPVAELGIGVQQLVELAAAFSRDCRILILDEPTAALTAPQVDLLFANVRAIAGEGAAVLYISHRLDELREIAGRATVLRDGRVVLSEKLARLGRDDLVRAMVGKDIEKAAVRRGPRGNGDVALRIERLDAGRQVRDVSLSVRRGEIVGLAGLIGSGRTTLLRAVFGADVAISGGVAVGPKGAPRRFRSPREAVRHGIAMVPEDRKRDGLLAPLSIRENVALGVLRSLAGRIGRVTIARESQAVGPIVERLEIRSAGLEQPVRELSGGNQQKVVVGRWLLRNADVILFDEPTRGVDVGARAAMYRLMNELAERGRAILVASSDLEELTTICDRIAVLSSGRLVAVFDRGAFTREAITRAAFEAHLG